MIKEEEIKQGLDKAYKEAGHNAYFGNGFEAGVKFALEKVKNIAYEPVLGVVNKYEIDFGNYCRAGIDIKNNKPTVIGAINGWGDGISLDEINIKDLNKQ